MPIRRHASRALAALTVACFAASIAGALSLEKARVVADVNVTSPPVGSNPSGFTEAHGHVYFAADSATLGRELWRTDGTRAGTALVKDINPTAGSSSPANFALYKGHLYFTATTDAAGTELWRTDGTEAGTVLVRDIQPGTGSSMSTGRQSLVELDGILHFFADDGSAGTELWRSDGTAAGTFMVKDLNGTSAASALHGRALAKADGRLYFLTPGGALAVSDGTGAGTRVVQALSFVSDLVGNGTDALFFAQDASKSLALYRPTPDVAAVLKTFVGPNTATLVAGGGRFYFTAIDAVNGCELWQSDGTPDGTSLVLDLNPGTASAFGSDCRGHVAFAGNTLYFEATDGTTWGLRKLEAAGGVTLLRAAAGGSKSADVVQMLAVGNRLLFSVGSPAPAAIWSTEGTDWQTVEARRFVGAVPPPLAAAAGRGWFAGPDDAVGSEPWVTDGTVDGTRLVADINPQVGSSLPAALVASGGLVFFTADDGVFGKELWASDGDRFFMVRDINEGSAGSAATPLASVNGRLLLTASDGSGAATVWTSDGTWAGTRKLGTPAFVSSTPAMKLGNRFVFAANPAAPQLYSTDGTPEGTVVLKADGIPLAMGNGSLWLTTGNGQSLLRSDGTVSGTASVWVAPANYHLRWKTGVSVDDTLFFVLSPLAGASESQLWRSDGTQLGTAAIRPIGLQQFAAMVRAGSTAYFVGGNDFAVGSELWKFGPGGAPVLLRDIRPGSAGSAIQSLTAVGERLCFTADDGGGRRLWCSDGTTAGTTRMADLDLAPGAPLFAAGTSTLVFAASDRVAGVEPWRLDLARGTLSLLQDFNPGPASSNPSGFEVSGNRLFFSGDDGVHGQELAAMPLSALDTTPPVITARVTGTSGSNGWYTSDVVVAWDLADAESAIDADCPAATIAADTASHTATCTATSVGGSATRTVTLRRDSTPPVVTCPADTHAEPLGRSGALVSYPAATVQDALDSSPVVRYSIASASWFPAGTTPVTVTGSDAAGNTATCKFSVRVADVTPPRISCPPNLLVEATGPAGAAPVFAALAVDGADAAPAVTYSADPGSTFATGRTEVTAVATDASGNSATCTFDVVVRDTTPPQVVCPSVAPVEASSGAGAVVAFAASATDTVDANPALEYSMSSGSVFPSGVTPVVATARDAAGNRASCIFPVVVRDTTPPQISCPASVVAFASGSEGAVVVFPQAGAQDAADPAPAVACAPPAGSVFASGTTTVTATARDRSGNSASCSFTVTVRAPTPPADTRPPFIACPADLRLEAAGPSGAVAGFAALAADGADPNPSVTYDRAPGLFPLGDTVVTATATDAAGNEAECTFTVSVADTRPPEIACPAPALVEATSIDGAVFAPAAAMVEDAVDPSPAVTVVPEAGSTFALGMTLGTATATDASGNSASCSFVVTVRDTTPPTIHCPEGVTAKTGDQDGAPVDFAEAVATDAVDGAPLVTWSHASGTRFKPGATTVTAAARDRAGNLATCSFPVTVVHEAQPPASASVPGEGGCGCSGDALPSAWMLLAFGLVAGRRRRS